MSKLSIEALLESGAHFGHLTRRWNPQMRPFIYGERNGIHIIDLRKTQLLVDLACDAARSISARGHKFLFVGTKKQAKEVIGREAINSGAFYVSDRWLGGMLTNFATIRKSIRRLENIEKMEGDGTIDKLNKKERLMISREKEKLERVFSGIRDMSRLPGALFIVDIKREHIAISEAKKLGIPVFAIVDTNADPLVVDYPIPANDDSIKTISAITKVFGESVKEGVAAAKIKKADMAASDDRDFKEADGGGADDEPKVRRKLRKRKSDETPEAPADKPAEKTEAKAEAKDAK